MDDFFEDTIIPSYVPTVPRAILKLNKFKNSLTVKSEKVRGQHFIDGLIEDPDMDYRRLYFRTLIGNTSNFYSFEVVNQERKQIFKGATDAERVKMNPSCTKIVYNYYSGDGSIYLANIDEGPEQLMFPLPQTMHLLNNETDKANLLLCLDDRVFFSIGDKLYCLHLEDPGHIIHIQVPLVSNNYFRIRIEVRDKNEVVLYEGYEDDDDIEIIRLTRIRLSDYSIIKQFNIAHEYDANYCQFYALKELIFLMFVYDFGVTLQIVDYVKFERPMDTFTYEKIHNRFTYTRPFQIKNKICMILEWYAKKEFRNGVLHLVIVWNRRFHSIHKEFPKNHLGRIDDIWQLFPLAEDRSTNTVRMVTRNGDYINSIWTLRY